MGADMAQLSANARAPEQARQQAGDDRILLIALGSRIAECGQWLIR
jgi:hypothetical protein